MNKHELAFNAETHIDLYGKPILNELDDVDLIVEDGKLFITWPDFDRDAMIADNREMSWPEGFDALDENERQCWDAEAEAVDMALADLWITVHDVAAAPEASHDAGITESIPYFFNVSGTDYRVIVKYDVLWG